MGWAELNAMAAPREAGASSGVPRTGLAGAVVLGAAVLLCSAYANASRRVSDPADYRFFPPFRAGVNANQNGHLGGEYCHVARSLAAGEGFANPFGARTGPTAWVPPVFPLLLAGLLLAFGGDLDAVAYAVVVFQGLTLTGTGLLVLALARRTAARVGTWTAVALFLGGLLCHFRYCFQFTHDCWLVLLAVDLLLAGWCWGRPLATTGRALGWGAFGGLCAQVSPAVGLAWATLTVVGAGRSRRWRPLGVAAVAAVLAVAPWTARNLRTFGRLIPIKSNLAFELYQSQKLPRPGLLESGSFRGHPYVGDTAERAEYRQLGEMAYLDRKKGQFSAAVRANPWDFLHRVVARWSAVTLLYVPYHPARETDRPWALWLSRLTYPLPFLSLLLLVLTARWKALGPVQWAVLGTYLVYLAPYAAVSYYERYAFGLLGVKVLLVVWGVDRLWELRGAQHSHAQDGGRQTVRRNEDGSPSPGRPPAAG
jgi:hypothetical protein